MLGETRVVVEHFFPFLQCSSHFPGALQQSTVKASLFFNDKKSLNSLRITFDFQKKLHFQREKRVVRMLHTPIEHATISHSESLLQLVWAIVVASRNFQTAESC